MKIKNGVLSGSFEVPTDLYVSTGYKAPTNFEEIMTRICSVKGLDGAFLCESSHLTEKTVPEAAKRLRDKGLQPLGLLHNVWAGPYIYGSIQAPDPKVRRQAIDHTKRWMDLAKRIDAPLLHFWPGNDGADFFFHADYSARWDQAVSAFEEICAHDRSVKVAVANKLKQPRQHIHISTIGKTVTLIREVGAENLGICLDPSHSMVAQELLGENIAFIDRFLGRDRLFYCLCSDNWRQWDDMIVPGSVNTMEFLEMLYWLDRVEYNGWIVFDQIPWREDPVKTMELGIRMFNGLNAVVESIDKAEIQDAMDRADGLKAIDLVRQALLPQS